jgi:glucose-6-phosphate 1-epimerase
LHIHLTSHNQGAENVTISQALHSYFAVSDVRNVQVEGLDGLDYIETLDDWKTASSRRLALYRRDRSHLPEYPGDAEHRRPAWERRIALTSSGSRSAVIWNPWTERAAAFSDMADDGWQRMLCIETANVWVMWFRWRRVQAILGVSIASKPL